ncbi:MAG: single-stranded DNA-binding protein [Tannerellaceae bacterium]|jgi:single-strand DNA-binding protein|nr:single-stranded DNA-binding protein [Tannerellaceae bacterium]
MSLNKVMLIGNVGKDPDVRYFDNGAAIANFTMATSERGYTLVNGTEVPERTEWHNIVVRRDQVAFVEKWIRKGSSVFVEGKIRSRSYDDQAGIKRYVTEIYAERVEFFNAGSRVAADTQSSASPVASGPVQPKAATTEPPLPSGANDADDLPF